MRRDDLRAPKLVFFGLAITSLLLPLVIPSILSKVIAFTCLAWIFTNFKLIYAGKSWLFRILACLVISSMVGMTITSNLPYGWSYLETQSSLLVAPLIILTSMSLTEKHIRLIIHAFVAGVLILNITSLLFISYDLWDAKNLQSNLIIANNIIVRIHPTFLSMYIAFCILFLVDQYLPIRNLDRTKIGWVVFSLTVLVVFLIWLNSRAGILAFVLGFLYFICVKWSGKYRLIGCASIALFLMLIFTLPFSRGRFWTAPNQVLKETNLASRNPNVYPLFTRLEIYGCDLAVIKWPEIIYGYGTGDFRDVLQACYAANDYERPLAENMDSHSEYFAQLHRAGVIGLGLFVWLMIVALRHSIRNNSPLFGSFVILFAVVGLFENVFSTQKGVTFFAVFCPLLWLLAKKEFEKIENSSS